MNLDYEKLEKMIEMHIAQDWKNPNAEWNMRKGGGEKYIQEEIIPHAKPQLAEDNLRKNAKEAVWNAIMVPKNKNNLLSQYEIMQSKAFIGLIGEDELRSNILSLLYGTGDKKSRLRKFIDWGKVKPVPGEKKKSGFSPQVASYLLAMNDPRAFAFCKPTVYQKIVKELIGKAAIESEPVKRMFHCTKIYSDVLELLERKYGLKNGNLLDVHSIFFKIKCYDLNTKEPSSTDPIIELTEGPLYELLLDKHNIILYGPPGTGKTREALRFAKWWSMKNGQGTVNQITFHPSYCYEDFIEGFRPTHDGKGFALKDGIFKSVCKKAREDRSKQYLLIIDEINRGDVARILGEIITLIEGDKRGENHAILLQQSGKDFFVPDNLYLLGTMNTADKSISLMDLAIRRRFLFYPCLPNPDLLDEDKQFHSEIDGISLSRLLLGLNQRLVEVGVDRDRILGHSYLLISKDNENPLEILMNRIIYEIIPLVEEYCYADRSIMGRILGDLVDDIGAVNTDSFDDPKRFVETLKTLEID
jgi:hypothetical protein